LTVYVSLATEPFGVQLAVLSDEEYRERHGGDDDELVQTDESESH